MIERLPPRSRAHANKVRLTEALIEAMPLPTDGQEIVWDSKTTGLSVLLSKSTKTYRATFQLNGKTTTVKIARFKEIELEEARKRVDKCRGLAHVDGIDPRKAKPRKLTFQDVLTQFIADYCKPRQKTWDQTERALTVNCASLLSRQIDTITRRELRELCNGFAKHGLPYKATNTDAHLRKMYRWAATEELIKLNVLAGIDNPRYEKRKRKPQSDEEVTALWKAADQLACRRLAITVAVNVIGCVRHLN
jgi:Arm DNA-binding domain